MQTRLAFIAFIVSSAACLDERPVLSREQALACGFEDRPRSVEQCVCVGARVEGDPGDGSASCDADETPLGGVPFGIEGAVCCLE
jgi:hypothetical protein